MKKLLLLLTLFLFSSQSLAGSCPDGSEPVKSVSADGTYYLFNCGSSEGSSSETSKKTESSVKVNPTELEMTSKFVGEFNLKKLSENSNLNLGIFTPNTFKFDINQDGYDDLIVGLTTMNTDDRNEQNEFSKVVILFWDNNIKEYVVNDEVQKNLPFMYFPRRIHGSINPKTGMTHLFIADTGFDLAGYDFSKGLASLPPNCGAQNHLITYDPSSGKVSEIQLPKLYDYSHGLATADLNGDKVTDYVALNSPYIKYPQKCSFKGSKYTNESYILYSNKNGGFDKVNIELNYKGYSKAPTITSGIAIVDENNDTFLLLGSEGSGSGIYAFKQDSKASFTETSRVNAPSIMSESGKPGAYSEVLYADINADGTKEVVASVNTTNWTGRYIQLLDFSNGQLRDRSEDVVQSNPALKNPGDWCIHLFFNETTAWGQPILTCTSDFPQLDRTRGYSYTWTDNKLQPTKMKAMGLNKWVRNFLPMTFDKKTVYVGSQLKGENHVARKVNGHSFYDVRRFNLIEPPKKRLAPSNTFDGSYTFKLSLTKPDGYNWSPGAGLIEIKNGILSILNEGRTLKDVTSSIDKFDTFEGQIDKDGALSATFEFNVCSPGYCEEEIIVLEGNNNKLSGISHNEVIVFELIGNGVGKTSNAFDGSYWFVFNKTQGDGTILGDGYGSLLINDGIVTVKKGSKGGYNKLNQMSPTFFDNFKGKIDKNGDIVASFTFSLCVGCGLEEKLVMFGGNIKTEKLSGLYHTHEVFFDMR